jgi:hypothetical protein
MVSGIGASDVSASIIRPMATAGFGSYGAARRQLARMVIDPAGSQRYDPMPEHMARLRTNANDRCSYFDAAAGRLLLRYALQPAIAYTD